MREVCSVVLVLVTLACLVLTSDSRSSEGHQVFIHENGQNDVREEHAVDHERCHRLSSPEDYIASISSNYHSVDGHFHDYLGVVIESCATLIANASVHIYFVESGKSFMWHTVALGYVRTLTDIVAPGLTQPVTMQSISHHPRVFSLSNLIAPHEAIELVEHALDDDGKDETDMLQRSTVGSGLSATVSHSRTGQTAWEGDSPLAVALQKRVVDVLRISQGQKMRFDATWIEDIQVVRYIENEMFTFHYDLQGHILNDKVSTLKGSRFREFMTVNDNSHSYNTERDGTDRFATVMFYLSDDFRGGNTAFSEAEEWWDQKLNQTVIRGDRQFSLAGGSYQNLLTITADEIQDICASSRSLSIVPRRLQALLFYSQTPTGAPDWTSIHAGCPVLQAPAKWIANIWVWNGPRKPYLFARRRTSINNYKGSEKKLSDWRIRNGDIAYEVGCNMKNMLDDKWLHPSDRQIEVVIECDVFLSLVDERILVFKNLEFMDVLVSLENFTYTYRKSLSLGIDIWDVRLVPVHDTGNEIHTQSLPGVSVLSFSSTEMDANSSLDTKCGLQRYVVKVTDRLIIAALQQL